jgi:predicted dehydrogenase
LEDYAHGLIRFADGTMLTLEASYFLNVPGKVQDTTIVGTKGAIHLADKCSVTTWTGEEPESVPLPPDKTAATSCIEHFHRVLTGQEDLIPTAEHALSELEITEAVYQSAASGRTVHVPAEAPGQTQEK